MTPTQAFNKLLRHKKPFAVTGPDDGQCTAVPHDLQKNILKIPIVYGNAVDIYANAPKSQYKKFRSKFRARKGDIVIWGQNAAVRTTRVGHVAVFEKRVRPGVFQSFDQNWPTGGWPQRIIHTYDGVIGFLRPKAYKAERTNKYHRLNRIYRSLLGRTIDKSGYLNYRNRTDSFAARAIKKSKEYLRKKG